MSFIRARAKKLHYIKCHNFCFPTIYILSMFSSYSAPLLRYKVCMAFPEICPNSSKHWANILCIYFGTNVSLQIAIEGCISSIPPKWNSCVFILMSSLVPFHQNHSPLILIPTVHKVVFFLSLI